MNMAAISVTKRTAIRRELFALEDPTMRPWNGGSAMRPGARIAQRTRHAAQSSSIAHLKPPRVSARRTLRFA